MANSATRIPDDLVDALDRRGLREVFESISADVKRAMAEWVDRCHDRIRLRRINLLVEMAASLHDD
jgi:uncharacterized protein YdeI (YjbR/CyaY-like superfamily)